MSCEKEQQRKIYTFWRLFDEKPSVTAGCPGTMCCMPKASIMPVPCFATGACVNANTMMSALHCFVKHPDNDKFRKLMGNEAAVMW